jgi:hypothetical protein
MTLKTLKQFIAGAALVGVSVPSLALAEPTCAYVIGHVNGRTVATPAVALVVPGSDAALQPVVVHLDEAGQTILGYSVPIPGASAGTEGAPVFVPGVTQHIPSFVFTLPEINLTPSRCVNVDGVSTPAVPVYIPASKLTLPGATANVGGILLNIVGHPVTAPGQLITFDGKQLVIPEQSSGVPSVPVGTPNQSIVVNVNGVVTTASYLTPNT